MRRLPHSVVALLAAGLMTAAAGCMVKNTEAPPLSGPSELGLALALSVTPDILPQDGWSQSAVGIEARGADGRPARGVSMRIETVRGGVAADYGLLSSRSAVTDDNGRARLSYTAPAAGEPVDTNTVVTIRVTPVGSNYANSVSREVQIRLTPPGVILPPNGAPVPEFTYSPAAPQSMQDIFFDASPTTDDGAACPTCSYAWTMGDGASKSGLRVTHSYSAPGAYLVSLTVTDTGGRSAAISKSVTVATGTRPTAAFTFSPGSPGVSQDIFFTAASSTPAPGRRIVAYDWDFGSGRTASGVTAVKRYDTAGTYIITLQVTDDLGQTGTTSQSVQVAPSASGGISASLVASPTSPKANQAIQFNAVGSRPSDGASLVEYRFNFGVPGVADVMGSSPIVNFTYTATGTYVVTVQVRDSAGRTAIASITITVTN